MADRRVLMFAYHFPPDPSSGSARPYRFAKYLSRHGYQVIVFTACETAQNGPFPVHCIEDPFLAARRRTAAWQLERAARKLLWPCAVGFGWASHAVKAAREVLRSRPNDPVTVFSTFPPLGSHLAGWRLSRTARLPWIADFRDPMALIPGVWEHRNRVQQTATLWLERWFTTDASAIIANTEAAARQFLSRHSDAAAKTVTIWNGFDPEERLCPLPLPPRPYRLYSHVGELYAGRSAKTLLLSIGRLVQAGLLDPATHRILLAGPMENGALPDETFLRQAEQLGWLELRRGLVPKAEAVRIAQSSDGLLLIQPQSAIQVPAKLFEYVQMGRPVLAHVPRNSETEAILARSGVPYVCVYEGNSERETDAAIRSFFQLSSNPQPPSTWFEETFNAERQTRALEDLIERSRASRQPLR